jgi:hypothetical protein
VEKPLRQALSRIAATAPARPVIRTRPRIPHGALPFAALAACVVAGSTAGCADPLSASGPKPGLLEIEGTEIELRSLEGTPAPPARFEVRNAGETSLAYVVFVEDRRFQVEPAVGTLGPGESEAIDVEFASRDLPPGPVGPLAISVAVEGSRRRPARVSYALTVEPDPRKPQD